MESVSNVLWPVDLARYVTGTSHELSKGDNAVLRGYITTKQDDLRRCEPVVPVQNYWTLIELVSQIAALNPKYELFFRGQPHQHFGPNGADHQLCPTLWREGRGTVFATRCDMLKDAEERLKKTYAAYEQRSPRAERKLNESPIARWALIQHYGIADTPLLDLTRSLQVACSFALEHCSTGYLYILGLPYQREMLMTDGYSGIMNVSLLGVTPHNARRPLAQDGYLASGNDWWRLYAEGSEGYSGKRDVDFVSRIVAVIQVEDKGRFWEGSSVSKLESHHLYPCDDAFLSFLEQAGFEPYLPGSSCV